MTVKRTTLKRIMLPQGKNPILGQLLSIDHVIIFFCASDGRERKARVFVSGGSLV
jgi:hypothetical protein